MSTYSRVRRRDVGKFTRHQSINRILLTIGISIILLAILFPSVNYQDSSTSQISNDSAEPNNSPENEINEPPYPGFKEGYELAPLAPGVPPQPPESPHWDGIPPITQKYKDPVYFESSTRSGGPKVINETVLLILVNFTDVAPTRTVSELENATFNTTLGQSSVHNYYKEVSYGVCNIVPGYLNGSAGGGWLKLLQTRKTYGQDYTSSPYETDDGSDQNGNWLTGGTGKGQFVKDALMAADNAGVDFAKYDNDGPDGIPDSADDDGMVDHVLIIFSGNGQNHYGRDTAGNPGPDDDGGAEDWGRNLLWPSRVFAGFGTYDGKSVFTATINPEDPDFTLPVGVTCHEFGHDMGLPDLYNVTSGGSVVGKWDVMDVGNYNTNSTGAPRPAHISAWGKYVLGWVKPIVINMTNNNQGVVQVNQTTSPTNDSVCYRVNIEGDNEYYLIENRNTTVGTFDEGLPDRGILIWHIDEDMDINTYDPPTKPYYAILLEDYQNNGDAENYIVTKNSACWKSSGAADQADFNVTTAPNSSANGGIPSGIYLDRIQDNALWNMTIRILVSDDTDPPAAPQNVQAFDAENDNGETINLTWSASDDDGGNDDDVLAYNIYMNDTGGVAQPKIFLTSVDATDAPSYKTQVAGLLDGVLYNFTVLADDGPNVSPYPGNFTAMPIDNIARIPINPTAADTNPDDGGNITLTWSLSEDDPVGNATGPADIIWYNISINDTGQGPGGSKHFLINLGAGTTTYKVGNLINNVPYYFTIMAVDDVFNKGYSTEVFATPTDDLVGSPINLQVTPAGWSNTSNYNIQWTNPTDNSGIVEAYYKLDTAPNNNNDFTGSDTGLGINFLQVTDTLSDGLHRVYTWLRDGENNRDYTSAKYVNIFFDGTAPAKPTGLTGIPTTWSDTNLFTLVWTNPTEVSGIGGVYYSIDVPPKTFNDGIYTAGININQLNNLILPSEGEHTVYIWLRDNANNTDYTTNVSIKLYLDMTSPNAPENVQTKPNTWTNVNSFDVSWTNPSDLSGIIGTRYKIDLFPTSDTDGIYVAGIDITEIKNIKVGYTGSHIIYIWLVDNASNANYANWNTTILRYDNHPPAQPINLQSSPVYWTNINSFDINWTNQWDHSGVAGVYYRLNSPPTNNLDGTFVPGAGIWELDNITVPYNGSHEFYIWLQDGAGNINYQNYSYIQLFYDALAPSPPLNLKPYPTFVWTSNNSFAVSWDNPEEQSGIGGAYYKLDSPPTSNEDGLYDDRLGISYFEDITVNTAGRHPVYVWLVDRMGNVNYQNYSVVDLLFDDEAPQPPINLKVTPNKWSSKNKFNITWTNPFDHSGIYGLYYKITSPTQLLVRKLVIKNNISSLINITAPGQGDFQIYVWLIDNAYNYEESLNSSQMLQYDISSPDISHSRVTYATKGLPITISAIVIDYFSDVKEAKLFYKHQSDELYIERALTKSGNIYTTEIPADFVNNETIEYYLYAADIVEKPNINYYGKNGDTPYKPGPTTDIDITITDEDIIPPMIVHQRVTKGTAGVRIALTATVTDDGSGVKTVKIFYRSKIDTIFSTGIMTNGNPYYYEISEQYVTTYGIEYYLYAVDNSPRFNEVYFCRDGLTSVDPASDGRYIDITISAVDDLPPEIIFGPEVTKVTSTSATIVWITNEPADSLIDYGLDTNLTIHGFNESFITLHSFILTGLTPDTTYYFRVSSKDMKSNGPTRSDIVSFKTMRIGEEDNDGDGLSDNEDPDDDNDNIPDEWELQYGLNPFDPADANLDNDNDGYSNLREYLDDSDPTDKTSTPVSTIDVAPPIIIHEPVIRVQIYNPIKLSATVVDEGSGVKIVVLHYKLKSASAYTAMNMTPKDNNIYTLELSGSVVTGDIEYYLEAIDLAFVPNINYYGKDGPTTTLPNQKTDVDVDVRGGTGGEDDDEGSILDNIVCLVVIIVLIVLIICFLLAIRSALRARNMAKHAMRYKSTTADGEAMVWEGDEIEELDEDDDLETMGDRVRKDELDVL